MSEPYIAEIRSFGFNFAPRGWAFCNGQLVSIAQNNALFAIIGTTYGGDGQSTFGLPNLQGRVPMHWGTLAGLNTVIGQVQGSDTVTLTTAQIPQHVHAAVAAQVAAGGTDEKAAIPTNTSFLGPTSHQNAAYANPPSNLSATFSPKAISPNGGSAPHENNQPYLTLNFCIALEGIFPQRN